MLDPEERELIRTLIDHLDHDYAKPDIAYVVRRLRALIDASDPFDRSQILGVGEN